MSRRFRLIVLGGVALAVSFHSVVGLVLGTSWPWTTFLYNPEDRFMDLVNSVERSRSLDPYFCHDAPGVATYPPFAFLVLWPLSRLSPLGMVVAFSTSTLLGFVLIAWYWSRRCFEPNERPRATLNMALGMLASYPLLFALDRGNLECWVALLYFIFITCDHFDEYPLVGSTALAMASAMKIYPAGFVALLVARRLYSRAAAVLVLAALLTLGSAAALSGGPTRSLNGFLLTLSAFDKFYVVGDSSLHYSTDPYNGLRAVSVCLGWGLPGPNFRRVYDVLSFFTALVCVLFVVLAKLPAWRRTSILGTALLLFPKVANDYKLLVLLPSMIQFLVEQAPSGPRERAFFTLGLLLLIPKHYFFWKEAIGLSCVLSPILLLSLVVVLIADGPAWKSVLEQVHSPLLSGTQHP